MIASRIIEESIRTPGMRQETAPDGSSLLVRGNSGGEADGTVGDADPTAAVRDTLQDQSFDEVIISTLPIDAQLPPALARLLRDVVM